MAAMSYDNSMFATTVSPVDELFAPSSPTTSEWHEEGIDDGYEADDESIAGTRPTPTNNASGQEDRSYWRPNQYTRAGAYESVYGIPRANPELDPERPWWEMLPDAEMHRTITAAIQHETSFDQLPPDLGVWMLRSLPADILGCFDMRVRHERVSATPPTASILTPTNRPIFDPDMIKGIYWATIAHSGWPFDELSKGTRHWAGKFVLSMTEVSRTSIALRKVTSTGTLSDKASMYRVLTGSEQSSQNSSSEMTLTLSLQNKTFRMGIVAELPQTPNRSRAMPTISSQTKTLNGTIMARLLQKPNDRDWAAVEAEQFDDDDDDAFFADNQPDEQYENIIAEAPLPMAPPNSPRADAMDLSMILALHEVVLGNTPFQQLPQQVRDWTIAVVPRDIIEHLEDRAVDPANIFPPAPPTPVLAPQPDDDDEPDYISVEEMSEDEADHGGAVTGPIWHFLIWFRRRISRLPGRGRNPPHLA
ncbi:uncharacterized protein CLAFUR5_02439 [Fulvia fulva]|uniref:Uncharacterized protein n=1 Tax=Passalora fulva TaxID=5499 RepID=A0A9Q8P4Z7_PASFU|nr:uncharacterized protein CLAFUR5_02439 [Fulvia fulva]UJO13483.1 hypothetical protein CLAFUR5_02439 [Fulvia fulva]